MPSAPASRSFRPDEPFRLVGGHVAADLVDTVDSAAAGPDRDRLAEHDRVVDWAAAAGTLDDATAWRLRVAAGRRPAAARAAYEQARWLRDVLRRLIGAVAEGELDAAAGRRALGQFDELLHDALGRLHVGPAAPPRSTADGSGGGAVAWRWEGAETRLESVLWPLLWEAARLLASPDAARLRVCAGVDCGWVYVDRSRNGLRRWCEMQTCGTREKGRRRAGRARGGVAR